MGLQAARAGMKIQSLPLTRGRLGGGCLLFSMQTTEGEAGCEDFFNSLLGGDAGGAFDMMARLKAALAMARISPPNSRHVERK